MLPGQFLHNILTDFLRLCLHCTLHGKICVCCLFLFGSQIFLQHLHNYLLWGNTVLIFWSVLVNLYWAYNYILYGITFAYMNTQSMQLTKCDFVILTFFRLLCHVLNTWQNMWQLTCNRHVMGLDILVVYHFKKIWNIPTGKTGLPFQTIRIFREFSSWMNPKNVFHLHSNRNFRNFLANGKQPQMI